MEIVVIGVGYVGLVTGACFAEMGHQVTCLDVNRQKIDLLKKNTVPFYEPGLEELIYRNQKAKRLLFQAGYDEGIAQASICFITVDTPSKQDGSVDVSFIESAACSIGEHLTDYTIVVNKSTAPVGTTQNIKKLIRKKLQCRGIEPHFDIASNPEFLKEGSAVGDTMKPDRIIIGVDSEKVSLTLKELYAPFNMNHNRILIMDLLSAEMTKYASNAMLATRISLMNEIARLCEKTGANINDVRHGIGADSRIGYHFLYAGAGYGGSCFPKDIRAFIALAQREKEDPMILKAVHETNERQKRLLGEKITAHFAKSGGVWNKAIAIWGLSFKPNTDDIREAPALDLIELLLHKKAILRLFDPLAMPKVKKLFGKKQNVHFCPNEYHAAERADAIVLITEWKQFRFVNLKKILSNMRGNAFFDGRNQYTAKEMTAKGFHYYGVGIPHLPAGACLQKLKTTGGQLMEHYEDPRLAYSPFRCD